MKAEKKSEFTPIQDEKVIARYLQFMVDFHSLITWRVREANILGESYTQEVLEKRRVILSHSTKQPSPKKLKIAVTNTLERKLDLQYNAQEVQIFATAVIEKIDLETITIHVEKPIYKIQRREGVRVKIANPSRCRIEVPISGKKESLAISPSDISLGGFSILVGEKEAAFFEKGNSLEKIFYHLEGKSTVVRAEVKNIIQRKNTKPAQYKIGFSVKNIPPAIEKIIYRLAFLQEVALLKNKLGQ